MDDSSVSMLLSVADYTMFAADLTASPPVVAQ
jgi:hypothetical protein